MEKQLDKNKKPSDYLIVFSAIILGLCIVAYSVIVLKPKLQNKRSNERLPNILLVTIDTLRADHVGCYGYERSTTPYIDSLAEKGTVFKNAISNIPWTTPSHFCFLTGAYAARHGSRDNLVNRRPIKGKVTVSLAEVLGSIGYDTGAFVSGYPLLQRSGLDAGFDHYDDNMQDRLVAGSWKVERRAPDTAASFKKWFSGRKSEKPWFVWVHLYDPHGPYTPRPEYKSMFVDDGLEPYDTILDSPENPPAPPDWTKIEGERQDRQYYISQYDAEIRMADDAVRDIMDSVEMAGQKDSTIVAVSADHGEYLGEHDMWYVHDNIYSQTLFIPMVFFGPGVPERLVRHDFAETIDVAPTLLGLAGVSVPGSMMGGDLFEAGQKVDGKEYVLSESARPKRFSVINKSMQWTGPAPGRELYDYIKDPLRKKSLFEQFSQEANSLEEFAVETIKRSHSPWPATAVSYNEGKRKSEPKETQLSEKDKRILKSLGYTGN